MDQYLGGDPSAPTNLATPARNRYFYGKLMDVSHFTLETTYLNSKRWLLNRLISGAGIACGLAVTPTSDGIGLVIGPGLGIDGWGREIVVSAPFGPIDPYTITDSMGNALGTIVGPAIVTICLAYYECDSEPTPVLVSNCEGGDCAAGTALERFKVLLQPGPAAGVSLNCPFPGIFGSSQGSLYGVPDVGPALVQWITQNCFQPLGDQCVVLAQINLPAQAPITQAMIDQSMSSFVANNQLLLQLILCLAERVEECCGSVPMPSPTPAPTPSPAPTPTTTPTPTPALAPSETFRIVAVEFLDPQGKVVQKVSSPAVPTMLPSPRKAVGIRVTFNQPMDPVSVTTAVRGGSPAAASFLVERVAPRAVVTGSVRQVGIAAMEYLIDPEFKVFAKGEYRVTLFGNVDLAHIRPAIENRSHARLDGEPLGLPSGNGVEGGDFVFLFES